MTTPKAHAIETRTAKYWLGEDGILRGEVKPGGEETLADTRKNIEAMASLAAGQKMPILMDMRAVKPMPREVRRVYVDDTAPFTSAVAFLVDSLVSRMVANFVMLLIQPALPFRLFGDEAEALAWLRGYL